MSDIDKHGDGDPHIAEFELFHNPEEVLRIGRDFQRQDTFRGAQHDTVKLLCDTIEYLRDCLSKQVGNAAAMREALVNLDKWLFVGVDGYVHGQIDKTGDIERAIKTALSAPPRQCDVGTAEEQRKRYLDHCRRTPHCIGCEASTNHLVGCEFVWAQTPYAAQEGAVK